MNWGVPFCTLPWYGLYLTMVQLVPCHGTDRTLVRYKPYQTVEQSGTCKFLVIKAVYKRGDYPLTETVPSLFLSPTVRQ